MPMTIKGFRWKSKSLDVEIDEMQYEPTEAESAASVKAMETMVPLVSTLIQMLGSLQADEPMDLDFPDFPGFSVHEKAPSEPEVQGATGKIEPGWSVFRDGVVLWTKNFGIEKTEQPNRLEIMESFATQGLSILKMAYGRKSLQGLVLDALQEAGIEKTPKQIDEIAGNLIQVCTTCFPDLAGTYDYTNWAARDGLTTH